MTKFKTPPEWQKETTIWAHPASGPWFEHGTSQIRSRTDTVLTLFIRSFGGWPIKLGITKAQIRQSRLATFLVKNNPTGCGCSQRAGSARHRPCLPCPGTARPIATVWRVSCRQIPRAQAASSLQSAGGQGPKHNVIYNRDAPHTRLNRPSHRLGVSRLARRLINGVTTRDLNRFPLALDNVDKCNFG